MAITLNGGTSGLMGQLMNSLSQQLQKAESSLETASQSGEVVDLLAAQSDLGTAQNEVQLNSTVIKTFHDMFSTVLQKM